MRAELKNKNEKRLKFSAIFSRYGGKTGWRGYAETTLLLTDLRFEDGSPAAGHIWIKETKECKSIGPFREGQKLSFEARIGSYEKGYKYKGQPLTPITNDFKLNRPTKLRKIM